MVNIQNHIRDKCKINNLLPSQYQERTIIYKLFIEYSLKECGIEALKSVYLETGILGSRKVSLDKQIILFLTLCIMK